MRPHIHMFSLSSNTSLLRHALPVLVQLGPSKYKSNLILFRAFPNPKSSTSSESTSLLRSSLVPVCNTCLPKNDRLKFSVSYRRRFSTHATHVNDPGSIDLPLMQSMEKKIKEQLNAESVSVKDAYGDGRHVSIDVVATSFDGQSAVNRQRMVYKAIWEELQSTVHAVDQMTTRTPAEEAARNDKSS